MCFSDTPLLENKKIPNFHFVFLIDMKFISNILKYFLRGSASFSGARLRDLKVSKSLKFRSSPISKCQSFKLSKLRNFKFQSFKKSKVQKFGTQTFQHFQNFIFSDMRNNMFQGCSHNFLYFLKYFGDEDGVRGSRFGHIFGRSKNIPKSSAIDQESLISHFGII